MTNDWPPLMPTAMAARYCGFGSAWGLRKAHQRKKIFPVGRRGGTGAYMWRRSDLDRFLRGEPARFPPSTHTSSTPNESASVSDALAELRAFMRARSE